MCRAPGCGCGCGFLLCSLQELTPHPERAETREVTAPEKTVLTKSWPNPGHSACLPENETALWWASLGLPGARDDGAQAPGPSSGAHAPSHCPGAAPPSAQPATVLTLVAAPRFRRPATPAGAPAPAFFPRRQTTSPRSLWPTPPPAQRLALRPPLPISIPSPHGQRALQDSAMGARGPPQPALPHPPSSLGLSRTTSRDGFLVGLLSRVLRPQAQPQPPCWLPWGGAGGHLRSPLTTVSTCWPSSSGGFREARSRQGRR